MGVVLTNEMIKSAQETERLYGVPASVTLGQIMLESGGSNKGGLSGLAYNYNNLFGVTAGSSWTGQTVTMSNKDGTDTKTYRVYNSIQDSINDHAQVLLNDRYTQYTSHARTAYEYASGVANGGYAEDKNYALKLQNIMRSNNLTKYDNGNTIVGNDNTDNREIYGDQVGHVAGETTDSLKWWGDLIVVIMTVLLIILAIVFFISAFSNMSTATNDVKSVTGKAVGGIKGLMKKGGDE